MDEIDQAWQKPAGDLVLSPGEVHVWRTSLDLPVSDYEAFLVSEERARAARFYFEKDRRYWTVARAVLRILLGRYLAIDPSEVSFSTNEYGKPAIVKPVSGERLHFNISHSGDLALYAFAYDREVGVDVEHMRGNVEYTELAAHFFSLYERTTLNALPATLQEEAFFLCWSRKEAYIKARGMGLSLPLEQFDVSLTPGEPARLLADRLEPQATKEWFLHMLLPGERYAGALVTQGPDIAIDRWQWS